MADYLLSIELREADSIANKTGDIILLEQSWCNSLESVIREFADPYLTGSRFELAVRRAVEGRPVTDPRAVQADPRKS